MAGMTFGIVRHVNWEHMRVVESEDERGVFFILGYNGAGWCLTLRDRRGRPVPFRDGETQKWLCRGVPGEGDIESEGDGLLLASVPIAGGDEDGDRGEIIQDLFSTDFGNTWSKSKSVSA